MKKTILTLLCVIISVLMAQAQFKSVEGSSSHQGGAKTISDPQAQSSDPHPVQPFAPRMIDDVDFAQLAQYSNVQSSPRDLPGFWIDGPQGRDPGDEQVFLQAVAKMLNLNDASSELREQSRIKEQGAEHVRYQQFHQGIEVYGAEFRAHRYHGIWAKANGHIYPSPQLASVIPSLSDSDAINVATQDLRSMGIYHEISSDQLQFVGGSQASAKLVIYHVNRKSDAERLVYHVQIFPSVSQSWDYFIDAASGEIIRANKASCQFHADHRQTTDCAHGHNHDDHESVAIRPPDGPATAVATDLLGVNRTINTYEVGGDFFLIDASRDMFSPSRSSMPNEPVGVIWTITGNGTSPFTDNFQASHVVSGNNIWTDRSAVSAHFNAGQAYEYFKNTHGRESLNGSGGNIISVIDVVDQNGNEMDNAFWNGQAMFYGNGDQVFSDLAAALDVAGHEISHGVVQTTANLEYIGQSGAMNESFADIFGAMIDRDDWQMGEDVVIAGFPSGALRDLSNPNQGLAGPQDINRGWQPDHMDEFVELDNTPEQDNGGVHINSGIPNKAFHNYAVLVGKSKAERVFYRALLVYLTKSSQFVDLRLAVEASAKDLFGDGSTEMSAASEAFVMVGIGNTGGSDTQEDLDTNPGDEYVICTDWNQSTLYIFNETTGEFFLNPVRVNGVNVDGPFSKPSVTDDGATVVYVASDNTVRALGIDYQTGNVTQQVIGSEPIWRSAVISKDGNRIAAITDELVNEILVFDFSTGQTLSETFELFNPTFSNDPNVSTGDVDYADAMEFDPSGEFLMYDAQSTIESDFGSDISYWDIGFLEVWDADAEDFGSGRIEKLFSQLPENTSIGNPTFSKNSPFIISFDFFDGNQNAYAVLGANIETGDVGTIHEQSGLGYPSYSVTDDQIIYDDPANDNISIKNVQANKIQGSGSDADYIQGGRWGTWYADGERDLTTSTSDPIATIEANVSPNAFTTEFVIDFGRVVEISHLEISDMNGRSVWQDGAQRDATQSYTVRPSNLTLGVYLLRVETSEGRYMTQLIKK